MGNSHDTTARNLLFGIAVVFVAAQLWGHRLFDNNWAFSHWQYLSFTHIFLWLVWLTGLVALFYVWGDKVAVALATYPRSLGALVILFGVLVFFQFDSFLYGGGNLRIAQIAQTETIIPRWYEYGTTNIVARLFHFFSLFPLHYNTAGVYAWKAFSFGSTLLSLLGIVKLAKMLAPTTATRTYFFLLLFFSPAVLLFFGFIGVEPVVVAASVWFSYFALKAARQETGGAILPMWLVVLVGTVMAYTTAFLLLAAVYVTLRSTPLKKAALAGAVLTYFALLAGLYYYAHHNLEFSRFILFLTGKPPHSDYGLFSLRHLGDIVQLLFVGFPLIIFLFYLLFLTRSTPKEEKGILSLSLLMALGGLTTVLVLDPVDNIVLDFPRFVAYLFPLALLLTVLFRQIATEKTHPALAVAAALALAFPFSYLPSYVRIADADPYVTAYLDKHESFYLPGCLAFRDAYFYRKELDKANAWEQLLPRKSLDYLNLEGVKNLSYQGDDAEALRTLYKIIAQNPYWGEARALFATIQMKLGRYNLAKPQIDTCLLLDPYNKEYLQNLYRYYRDIQNYPQALLHIQNTLKLYPHDNDIKTDLMIVYYRSGALQTADSLAQALLKEDSSLAYPYLIRGFLAELQKDTTTAIALYKKFISLAPNDPDTPKIQERLNDLLWDREEE